MDTPARLLRLLALLTTRGSWQAGELSARLEITERTVRRDITRLRELGYPVEGVTGPYGGYSLGAGGRLPPLLLDDEEAVAVAVALHAIAQRSSASMVDSALSALTKLSQVMPTQLRERVGALAEVTVGMRPRGSSGDRPPGVDELMGLALACRRSERVRFDYATGDGVESARHVEPFRLVAVGQRWYLVALDVDRDDWRTFRVDRISRVRATGARFVFDDPPDPATLVAEGLALRVYERSWTIRVLAPVADVSREVSPIVGVCRADPDDPGATLVEIGGDVDWVARYMLGLPVPCEAIEPELRDELRRLGERLVGAYA
ncbi:MAG: transcriptional regulator [Ilumatobacteraceae bacterium]|nr:transcriptional regulator [Ilumatobacteraceae bacterium]